MKYFAMLLVVILLVSLPFVASAQTDGSTGDPVVSGCTPLPANEANEYVGRLGGTPAGASVLAVYICAGFNTYTIGNTVEFWNSTCNAVNVYKVSDQASQDLWQQGTGVCNAGDSLAIIAQGTGHYIIYGYGTVNAALESPRIIQPLRVGAA